MRPARALSAACWLPAAAASGYAAISLVERSRLPEGVAVTVGQARKHGGPLFGQTEPWEPRLDNGYPNVVPPSDSGSGFQLWYGDCADGCMRQMLLYANSTDGLAWTKPHLGLVDLRHADIPRLARYGTANNIVIEAGGVGVWRDDHDPDPSRRYKALGPGCWRSENLIGCDPLDYMDDSATQAAAPTRRWYGASAVSPDGLTWSHVANISWPAPMKWDTHTNAFYDPPSDQYILTTRDLGEPGVQRAVGVSVSPGLKYPFHFDGTLPEEPGHEPLQVLMGSVDHQLYAQQTFPWLNIYLGVVMVFDANSKEEEVHCRLVWTRSPHSTEWEWVDDGGLTGADLIPLGSGRGAFDSHICFAAKPFQWQGAERLYYMGGNGPHGGARNSSFGLATLRQDGYAAVTGTGTFVTIDLLCTGPRLTVTADFHGAGASLRVGLSRHKELPNDLSYQKAVPITSDATNALVQFDGGADFSNANDANYVGHNITLQMELRSCSVFAVDFE